MITIDELYLIEEIPAYIEVQWMVGAGATGIIEGEDGETYYV